MATQSTHPAPPAKPAAPPPAAKPPEEKTAPAANADKEPEETVTPKEQVRQLFVNGVRFKKKGDPPEKWIAAVRVRDKMCLAQPLTEELEKKVLDQELVALPD